MSQTKPLINGSGNIFGSSSMSGNLANNFSSQNTTNKILGVSSVFTGHFEDALNYSNLILNIKSDVSSETNGVIVEFGNLINIIEFKYEYTYKTSEIFLIQIPIATKYYRVRYVNGIKAQTNFNLFAMLVSGSKVSSGSDGLFDAFGRLRVSDVKTLLDLTHTFDNGTLMIDEKLTGNTPATTYNEYQSSVITSITGNGQKVIRQSRKYCVYQPGKSLLVKFTCILNARLGGNDKYTSSSVGYFDDSNGYFFKYSENTLKIVYRTKVTGSIVDEETPQSKWNLNTLSSLTNGYVLNPSKVQIYFMDLQWLGVGRVRLGVVHNGNYLFCHEFLHDNILDKVYITNANLPIRHELSSVVPPPPILLPVPNNAQCKLICSSVISEGGYDPVGMTYSISRDSNSKVFNSTEVPLLSIRLKSTRNRTTVIPINLNIINTDTSPSIYYLRLFRTPKIGYNIINPLVGPFWNSVHDNSAVEYDLSATSLVNDAVNSPNAIIISQGYFITKADIQINIDNIFSGFLQLTSNIDGYSDVLVLSGKSLSTTQISSSAYASIQWKEIY